MRKPEIKETASCGTDRTATLGIDRPMDPSIFASMESSIAKIEDETSAPGEQDAELCPISLIEPEALAGPTLFSVPHAGRTYPDDMDAAVDLLSLRRMEDAYVDKLVQAAPELGVPLLLANLGRAYIDVNRAPSELDADMFDGPISGLAAATSPRVAAGLGVIARRVTGGKEIYDRRLSCAEAERRISQVHQPYHAALGRLLSRTQARFGRAILIDWHSMPSSAAGISRSGGRRTPDFILGDRFGQSCAPKLTRFVEQTLQDAGYAVTRNQPYAGGYTTEHYGRPSDHIHVLQIEINRALYLDELRVQPTADLQRLQQRLTRLTRQLVSAAPDLCP